MLKMRLAAERLKIRVLQPGRAGLLIAQPLHVLEQMHARHQPRRQTASPLGLVIERPKRVIEPGPVDQFGQPQKLMFRINNRLQGAAEKVAGWRFWLLWAHHEPRWSISTMRPNHIAVSKGVPRVHRRTKSQDFGPKPNQTLQNSLLEKPNYGRPSNGLGKLHGRLATCNTCMVPIIACIAFNLLVIAAF